MHYLRICPQCRHNNPEQSNHCQECGLFIGMEPSVLAKIPREESGGILHKHGEIKTFDHPSADLQIPTPLPQVPDLAPTPHEHINESWNATPVLQTPMQVAIQSTLATAPQTEQAELLCLGYNDVLVVPPGATIGQQHAQHGADVPIPATINEAVYLHRRHCRLDKEHDQWWITAINQAEFGRDFTNPTRVNDVLLAPGEKRQLHNGDLLRLSGLRMQVQKLS